MNLRFRVLSQPNNVLPSAYMCAAAGVVVNKSTIGLTIYVNDVLFFAADPGTLTDVTTYSGTIGGVDAEFSFENTDWYKLNLDLANLSDEAKVKIDIYAPEGYRSYSNEFTVYGYDIGNNPNIAYPPSPPFPGNPLIDITLVPTTFVPGGGDPVSTNLYPCAKFAMWRKPGTYDLQVVKITSALGNYGLYDGTTFKLLGTGPSVKVIDSKAKLTKVDYIGGPTYFEPPSTSTEVVYEEDVAEIIKVSAPVPVGKDDFPSMTFAILTPGVCDTGCDCISDESNVRITLDSDDLYPFVQDDIYVYGSYASFDLVFTLIDKLTGLTVDTATDNISYNITSPTFTIVSDYSIPNTLDFDQQYDLVVQIKEGAEVIYEETFLLEPCALKELTRTSCDGFLYTNKASDAVLEVYHIDAEGTETLEDAYTVAEGETAEFTLEDGVYILKVKRADVLQYSYKVFVYCQIASCLTGFINAIGCKDPCADPSDDCGCAESKSVVKGTKDELYDMAAFTLMALTYLQEVNAIYATNWIFTVLPDDQMQHLKDLAILSDRLTKYCTNCA